MTYSVRPAKRSNAKPLIGVYSLSGAGKTYTSLLLARGFVGPQGRIIMIETEGGRGESYADPTEYPEIGGYDVISLSDNFAPQEYGAAIALANSMKPDALIIDSASHEWEGSGGVLDMAAKNQAEGAKAILVWQKPKIEHQRHFMIPLMQTPIPLVIVCMRAKYPMEERPKKNGNGKEWVRSEHLEPKQSEDILYEMFVHFWIDMDHNIHVTKCTNKALRDVFLEGKPVNEQTGQLLATWATRSRAGSGGQPTGTAPTGPTGNGHSADLVLHDHEGQVATTYTRWSDWLTGLEAALQASTGHDIAQLLWEQNAEMFNRGMAGAAGKPRDRFNQVGALALKMRTPAEMAEQF